MANQETLEALANVLSQKIYPAEPELVRNDARTARLVLNFVQELKDLEEQLWEKFPRLSDSQFRILETTSRVRPLTELSESTLRKYISLLWKKKAFDSHLSFGQVKKK